MKRLRNLVLAVTAVVLALTSVPTSAWAATTKIHRNDQFGALYSGKVRATLIGNVSISTSLATATCNVGVIDGTVQSDGTMLNVLAYNFSNSPGPQCPNSAGGQSTVTAVGLPWNNGNVTYAPVPNGRDGTIALNSVKVTSTSTGWFGTINCTYRGSGAGNSIVLDAFNPTNTNRPQPVVQAQARAVNYSLNKDSGSFLCPGTATFSATFQLLGETTANSGVYDQKLHLTS
ncbi:MULTISPECIES: hypothetical protein [Streptosporangium]|uniref:Uncharacterized protein n=1 Tax=Streptosporangium brasiliense TaxID=47480 RepID=A0ABT9RN23_9ACTN|nr:hypothetical protein [Streptosporangium brasiliense]MDP9870247.1 hypothetical protein [Streptosporangium brasiliense]